MENSQTDNKYLRAKERIDAMKKFYSSLMSSIIGICILAAINYYSNQWAYPWFLWAAFGFGIALAFKAVKAFGLNPFFGRGWEERKIEQFMQEDERKTRWE